MVRGAAPAGGTVLSIACDYKVGQAPLTMGLTEVKVGMSPPLWVHQLAKNAIGRHANVYLQTGETTDEAGCLSVGFIDHLVESTWNTPSDSSLEPEAMKGERD
jgi:Delta3-Delta2-enoyl-CoA isomerase